MSADPITQKMVSFLVEHRPLECTICTTTIAFQNKRTGGVVCVGVSGCGCLSRVLSQIPPLPHVGKEVAPKGEDHVDRGIIKEELEKAREQKELDYSMKEGKFLEEESKAKEQKAIKKKKEDEAAKKLKEQDEVLKEKEKIEALKRQREKEEELNRQRAKEEDLKKQLEKEEALKRRRDEEDLRRLKDGEALKKMKEDEAKEKEMLRKWLAEKEKTDKEKLVAAASASIIPRPKLGLPIKTWTDMRYSPTLKSGAIVHVVFAWSPIDFQVVCDEDYELLENLQADLLERVTSGKLKKFSGKPSRDDVVIAEYDGAYYRAKISNASSVQCQLSFIDYGDKAIKKNEEVYEIPEDLYRTPVYGLKLRLDGFDATDVSIGVLASDTVETVLYETAYSLELTKEVGMCNGSPCGILRDVKNPDQTLNDVVKNILLKL